MGENEEEMHTGTISVENPEWTSELQKAKQKDKDKKQENKRMSKVLQ